VRDTTVRACRVRSSRCSTKQSHPRLPPEGQGWSRLPVIAKVCRVGTGTPPRSNGEFHEQILPSATSVRRGYARSRPSSEMLLWLFLEDLGDLGAPMTHCGRGGAFTRWLWRHHGPAARDCGVSARSLAPRLLCNSWLRSRGRSADHPRTLPAWVGRGRSRHADAAVTSARSKSPEKNTRGAHWYTSMNGLRDQPPYHRPRGPWSLKRSGSPRSGTDVRRSWCSTGRCGVGVPCFDLKLLVTTRRVRGGRPARSRPVMVDRIREALQRWAGSSDRCSSLDGRTTISALLLVRLPGLESLEGAWMPPPECLQSGNQAWS